MLKGTFTNKKSHLKYPILKMPLPNSPFHRVSFVYRSDSDPFIHRQISNTYNVLYYRPNDRYRNMLSDSQDDADGRTDGGVVISMLSSSSLVVFIFVFLLLTDSRTHPLPPCFFIFKLLLSPTRDCQLKVL